jgi:hypothetical protein
MAEDLTHLPKAPKKREVAESQPGFPPDKHPAFLRPLAEAWWDRYVEKEGGGLAHAVPDTLFRASMAGMCSRRLGYYMEGTIESDQTTVADAWRFELGHYVHNEFQQHLAEAFPNSKVELHVDYRNPPLSLNGSAHADMTIEVDGIEAKKHGIEPGLYLIEIKSVNGFAYKAAATAFRYSPPEGPKIGAFLQGGMSALQLDADFLVIVNVAMENLSPKLARAIGAGDEIGRFGAQWTYTRDEFEPAALMEATRVQGVIDAITTGRAKDIPRSIIDKDVPPGAVIVNPQTSAWEARSLDGRVLSTGQAWHGNYCEYCPYQTTCAVDG